MQKWHDLVLNKAQKCWAFLSRLIAPLLNVLNALIGHWQPPSWFAKLKELLKPLLRWCATRAAWILLAASLAIGSVATPVLMQADYGAYWQKLKGLQMQVKAKLDSFKSIQSDGQQISNASIEVTRPTPANLETDAKPQPVIFTFNLSAAPLTLVGKAFDDKTPSDITINPAIKGHWLWLEANRLSFTPDEEWPIDVEYNVLIGSKALAPHVLIDPTVSFKSPSFEMSIANSSFYQDPVQTNLRKAMFDVTFSHPDAA